MSGDKREDFMTEKADGAGRPTRGLVLEGGGMRGLYTAGVLDVWMEHGIEFDAAVGVSAGAAFGCNLKSRQPGRVIRYNKRFCPDPRYVSLRNWVTTGDLFSRDFAYREVPLVLDPFDAEALAANPMRFTAVCTDIETGEAAYLDLTSGDEAGIDLVRASASIPVLSRPVRIDGHDYLDGGVADSIPVAWMCAQGHERNVAVLTRPAGYRKEPNGLMPLIRLWYRKYPAFWRALENRHERYNATLDDIAAREEAGELFVMRPSESVKLPGIVRDPEELERVYQVGRRDAQARLGELERYLA